jgi:hypothetical protein
MGVVPSRGRPKHCALTRTRVAEAEARLGRQRETVERLRRVGSAVSVAQGLLDTMSRSLELMRDHLRLVESELAGGDAVHFCSCPLCDSSNVLVIQWPSIVECLTCKHRYRFDNWAELFGQLGTEEEDD